ncbi:uncharacterized protein IL334_001099 [Kwoniella shivajii]|uniref:NOT2/NOT3/NOT5 C-terminal domain-containing protein n=1 Tax=Kwoniella shivajii TaxID=564305 RepID=A0ABZ1CRC2_9TREE|nr:hypothetical protein IL334_001099 [Kwoniella shivajii]
MYYATAGQQATQPPPSNRTPMSGFPRAGPPGFSSRAADPNDFPALGSMGSHPPRDPTYAAQTQPSATGSAQQNIQVLQQQQLFLQQQQQQQQMGGGGPPPPPGISGPNSSTMSGQANGGLGDEFPALNPGGDIKDRMANYLRNPSNLSQQQQQQHHHQQPLSIGQQPTSPPIPNGTGLPPSSASASVSQSTNATPSTNPPHPNNSQLGGIGTGGPPSTADSSWQRLPSPTNKPSEPVVRPVQQILSSPVDKWGLKALLYEIQMHMNKTDRGMLVFGEELEDLGMDISGEESLYPSFVTPWADPNSLSQPPRIEEAYHIPQCYNVHAPPVTTKLPNFTEDTLFLAFYMSPGDILQLEVAEELYARGWRYHVDLQTWLTSPTLPTVDLMSLTNSSEGPQWIRGPFMYLDTRTWTKQRTNEDFTIDANLLEVTRPANIIISEDKTQGSNSPISVSNGNGNSNLNPSQQGISSLLNSSNPNNQQSYTR